MLLNNIKKCINNSKIRYRYFCTTSTSSQKNNGNDYKSTANQRDRESLVKLFHDNKINFPSMNIVPKKPKVTIGLSGGVDSTVAAYLLKKQGFDVNGVFIKSWDEIEETGRCTGEKDFKDAQEAAKFLNINVELADFTKEYWNRVFQHFLKDYENGLIPNPDTLCNREIKFDTFIDFAKERFDSDYIVTGHYANLDYLNNNSSNSNNSNVHLYRGKDYSKDQSYFLCMSKTEKLAKSLFPIGQFMKNDVKDFAQYLGLDSIVSKKSSRGICFIGKKSLPEFLSQYIKVEPGRFYDLSNTYEIRQEHKGALCYTRGQKAQIHSLSERYFVAGTDIERNLVFVCPESVSDKFLLSTSVTMHSLNWIGVDPDQLFSNGKSIRIRSQIKHRGDLVDSTLCRQNNNEYTVTFDTPIRACQSGQVLCMFEINSDRCLGGGVMKLPPFKVGKQTFGLYK
ncbi:hypothetical protein CYY_002766 [Polysphondylium violaceum]|uniref:tRNA-5-taurinomethyluridine 2-sulfurtransferase n=1 Tax=Polysphondylium violaceum TaxID=133409 RepID=A0A8J4PVS4_9MYCE|nr:hypothetical protein CYY_002766 [Polysphondylium violaceum]